MKCILLTFHNIKATEFLTTYLKSSQTSPEHEKCTGTETESSVLLSDLETKYPELTVADP